MELILTCQTETQVIVTCNGHLSHQFDLQPLLIRNTSDEEQLVADPMAYGKKLYQALFPAETPARDALAKKPERLLLVAPDQELDAVPWEYVYGPTAGDDPDEGFLVLEVPFVRGVPAELRVAATNLEGRLHIVAIPSNPLSDEIDPLTIDAEWLRLKEIVRDVPYQLTLERTRPATLERTRQLVANHHHRVVHFMGHGGQDRQGAFLCFEKDNGDLARVSAKELVQRVRGSIFLVTLNACVSATPGPTPFSNLAAALVRQKIPYALGMRLSIYDEDARIFSRTFYSELARGVGVEEALLQTRLTLAGLSRLWVVGVPVLYTALAAPASGFICVEGKAVVKEHQPPLEVSALPRAEGIFQGRIQDLKALGCDLTGDRRARILTIHGGGGQGKTALAREVAERFAYAWPGGVWAISLEHLPDRTTAVIELARFLGIQTQEIADPNEIERQVAARLADQRTLLVLDNAETLVEAVERNNHEALHFVEWIRQLPSPLVSLLITSRILFGWSHEKAYELGGLSSQEGAALFMQCAPQRRGEVEVAEARRLSLQLEGHPLGLRLVGGTFNAGRMSLKVFVQSCVEQLREAEDKYVHAEHRQRKLYACIQTSLGSLDEPVRALLSGLWIFQAPFSAETAVAIFDPDVQETTQQVSGVRKALYVLWQRSLLTRKRLPVGDSVLELYYLLPTTRPYVEHHLPQEYERDMLLARFGAVSLRMVKWLFNELDRGPLAVIYAQQAREDLEQAEQYLPALERGSYLRFWGWIVHRLGNPFRSLTLLEMAVEIAQGTDQTLELAIFNNIAMVYNQIGMPRESLKLYEQALPISREGRNRAGEAALLNNIAQIYSQIGEPEEALKLYEQALLIKREVGDRVGEARVLNNMAGVYSNTGKPQEALKLYEQALMISREVGDRAGAAAALTNMAWAYSQIGKSEEALRLYEQSLPIMREVGDRTSEAKTLNNIAMVYSNTGKPQEALKLYEQALMVSREVGDRASEARALSNMAEVYGNTGKPQEVLKLCEQALPVSREVGDRAGEAVILGRMAEVYSTIGKPGEALKLYEQILSMMQKIGDRAQEARALINIAQEHNRTGKTGEALRLYERALPFNREVGDRAGKAVILSSMAEVYSTIGKPGEALKLYEQALMISREIGDRAREARTLGSIARVYSIIGKPEETLKLYRQTLPMMREVGDRAGEASMLSIMAEVYSNIGKPGEALKLYEQALMISREIGDRAREARTLGNIARVYSIIGKPEETLKLYEQALMISREVGDRALEAATLNNMGVHGQIGEPGEALKLYEQALMISREVGDRAQEATTLNNMAMMYNSIGKLEEALKLYEQALMISRKVRYRAGEAATLNGLASLYQKVQRYEEAFEAFKHSIMIAQQISSYAFDIAGRASLALLLYQHLDRPGDAIMYLEQAIHLLQSTGLPQDASGNTVGQLQALLDVMRQGSLTKKTIDPAMLKEIIDTTISAMTETSVSYDRWRNIVADRLQEAQQKGAHWQPEVDLFTAILTLLDGGSPALPARHLYTQTVATIQAGIARASEQGVLPSQEFVQIPDEVTKGCIAALSGTIHEKIAMAQYLTEQDARTTDTELRQLLLVILKALAGQDLSQLGAGLRGPYRLAWEAIVVGIGSPQEE